jgi:hypothetical protein
METVYVLLEKDMKTLDVDVVGLAIALVMLNLMAWYLNEPASAIVGWLALGIAASASMSKR